MIALESIRAAVVDVARRNKSQRAILFGSYARGTATKHSDVDLIFIEETTDPFLKRLDRYLFPLSDRLGGSVETLVYTPAELESISHRPFIQRALREGIVLYESGKTSS
ncbi:MAG TPA: nucleotidyltransferase domain-containing protein [Verrucomicrobiae bacterium]|nr:nucleotidyltransferase domain-containing protein [Verrucomicrobiae bacterium]